MNWLRIAWRLPSLLLLCIPVLLCTVLGRTLRSARLRDLGSHCFGRGVLAILGGRLSVRGEAPRPPYVLVSNHLGYLDVLVLLAALSRPRFISKAEVRGWPLLGPLARLGRTIFLQRERVRELPRTMRALESALAEGDGVVFFPEGTSSGGSDLLPFRAPLFEPLARLRIPLRCASLRYRGRHGALGPQDWLCWWRDMPFGSHFLRLCGGPGFAVELRFAGETLVEDDRKRLARAAEQAVRAIFEPTGSAEASMVDLERTTAQHQHLLAELEQLLLELPEALYRPVDEPVVSEGVGAHLRHVLEFYDCLFEGLDGRLVDYDRRRRSRELESSPQAALARLREIRERLSRLREDRPLRVLHDRVGDDDQADHSSLARELRFLASHAVHHFAIVAMLLRLRGHELPVDFGVAPSTLKHRRQVGIASG